MTNCIGFVNLTTGTSDRGPWHWLAMLCPTNHNNTSSVMSQMWNNLDSLRNVWCYANSCLSLSKVQRWPTTDQMRRRKSQRVHYTAPLRWVESGEDTLVCSGFCLWHSASLIVERNVCRATGGKSPPVCVWCIPFSVFMFRVSRNVKWSVATVPTMFDLLHVYSRIKHQATFFLLSFSYLFILQETTPFNNKQTTVFSWSPTKTK